jgi:glycosyltransferase involved in cell wall biosynthesis
MAAMKAVLLLAYEFPPLNVGGAQRPYRFACHLMNEGYHTVVVTPEVGLHQGRIDSDYIEKNPADNQYTILRTGLGKPKHGRLKRSGYTSVLGDEAARWRDHCIAASRAAAREHDLVAVIVTVPPFSIASLAAEIADILKLPLILDMRDAWSQWVITPYATRMHYMMTKLYEAAALRRACRVITTSDETRRQLLDVHPTIAPSKIVAITNSFETQLLSLPQTSRDPRRFIIGYVGSFYYEPYQREMMFAPWWRKKPHQMLQYAPRREDWLYRSPEFFFRALVALRQIAPETYDRLDVHLVGSIPDWLPRMIDTHELQAKITLFGPVTRSRSLELQRGFDALLITSSKVIGGRDYSIAGKTFEYISTGLPIIAFVCEGAQRDLLATTGLAQICDPDDLQNAVAGLRKVVERIFVPNPNSEAIGNLSVSYCVRQLADLIQELEL